jgi:hypothetical protein
MRKPTLLVTYAATAIVLGTVSSWASGNNWFVDPEIGADSAICGGESNVSANAVPPNAAANGPCATLNQALTNASAGDNIIIEKPGVFGPIFLTDSISIIGPADGSAIIEWLPSTAAGCIHGAPGSCTGTSSGDTSSSTPLYAVDAQAGSANVIKFKNVLISNGAGTNGAVHIGNNFGVAFKQCAIRGGSGTISEMMYINPSALNSSNGPVQVYFASSDVAFSSSGGGVYIAPTVSVNVLFQGGEVHNSNFGIKADATAGPLPSGSSIYVGTDATEFFSQSTSAAIAKTSPTSGATGGVHYLLSRSTVTNTGSYAVYANGANASMILYEDTITGTFAGVNIANGGTIISMQDNEIFGNTNNCEVGGTASACDGGALTVQTLQ